MLERSRTKWMVRCLLAPSFVMALAVSAHADIVSTGAVIEVRGVPTPAEMGGDGELDRNEIESDSKIFVWFERTVDLTTGISVGHRGSGYVDENSDLNRGTIAAGTTVSSYYLLFDQRGSSGSAQLSNWSEQYITFDSPIVGLYLETSGGYSLASSDALFRPDGVTYHASSGDRGLELGSAWNRDRFQISADGRTLTLKNLYTRHSEIDAIRILTLSVPEPGSAGLFALGLGLVGALVRRRRKRVAKIESASASDVVA